MLSDIYIWPPSQNLKVYKCQVYMFVEFCQDHIWEIPKIAENLQGSTAVADSGISTVHICVVEILGSGNYFDDPLHICFVVRKENKTHIENIACMLQ